MSDEQISATPGPWHVEIRSEDNEIAILDVAGNFVAFADCDCKIEHADKAEADARLIAASPTMLAALRLIEAALRKDSRGKSMLADDVEYHLDGQTMHRAINLAREAIAEATCAT